MTNDNNLSVSRIEERKSLQLPRREASGVSPRRLHESYSIAAGLDFPSVGPQHAYLQSIGRAQYVGVTDAEALEAFMLLSLKEGIIPALESSHALAYALKLMNENPDKPQKLIVNLSGRGDKDIFQVRERFEEDGVMPDGHLSANSLALFRQKYL